MYNIFLFLLFSFSRLCRECVLFCSSNKIFTLYRHCSAKYMRLMALVWGVNEGKKCINYIVCVLIYTFIRLIHLYNLHIVDTFGFRSLMLIKFDDIHYIHGTEMEKKRAIERKKKRERESNRSGFVSEDTSLTPDASRFSVEITNSFVEIKPQCCRQCQLNQQHTMILLYRIFLPHSFYFCYCCCVYEP